MKTYSLDIAGLRRELPICKVSDDVYIAAFIALGDTELSSVCARELLRLAPPHDVLMTAEAKGIPIVHEMARQAGQVRYVVARKSTKLYMNDILSAEVRSITTARAQTLYIDGDDAALMRGRRVLIVDDVISTGESLRAIETLVHKSGGQIVGRMAALAEGDARHREDIQTLGWIPLLTRAQAEGTA